MKKPNYFNNLSRYSHKNFINKLVIFVVIFVFIILLALAIFYFFKKWLLGPSYFADVDPDAIKAKSGAVPPAPETTCDKPADIGFVCNNYSACCSTNSNNCNCKSPLVSSCQKQFNDCLSGSLFSPESIQFLGSENLGEICKKFATGCCAGGTGNNPTDGYNLDNTLKPNLDTPKICETNSYEGQDLDGVCAKLCNQIDGCTYYVSDSFTKGCTLYSGQPLKNEAGASASSSTKLFTKGTQNSKSEFADLGSAADFCASGAADKCPGSGDCYCSHSVVQDCMKLKSACMSAPGAKAEICNQQFGGCCKLIDDTNIGSRFNIADQPVLGSGTNKLCNSNIKTLSDCKQACLKHDKCRFIDTNLTGANSPANGYCYLFSGEMRDTPMTSLSKNAGGKTIYVKSPVSATA